MEELIKILSALPPHCLVIGGGNSSPFIGQDRRFQFTVNRNKSDKFAALNLLFLPEAHAHVFMAHDDDLGAVKAATSKMKGRRILVEDILGLDSRIDYKMFVIFAGHDTNHVDLFLEAFQKEYPRVTIVGGVFRTNIFSAGKGACSGGRVVVVMLAASSAWLCGEKYRCKQLCRVE